MLFGIGSFLLALALIGIKSSLNFTAVFYCFCKSTSFFSFVLEKTFSIPENILVFSGIVLIPGEEITRRIFQGIHPGLDFW